MDSISQFVLGAAVGEVVLGKKLGNKAVLLGGIAGTIPDLDVLAGPFISEVDALAFHRGISHSIFFSVLGGLFFGWLSYKIIKRKNIELPKVRSFQWMFFWAFLTHALLDAFTMYGTQLFAPFTNYRLAFSTISVADPLYTLPFLICLVIAMFFNRRATKRRMWNYIGIGWSCLYLMFTIVNKSIVNSEFQKQLLGQGIEYERMILGPTILNNILWSATVETNDSYYQGQYSLFDKSPIEFRPIIKNHSDLPIGNDRTLGILKWFTHGYYNIMKRSDGKMQFNDLRYGTFKGSGDGENDYIFRFVLDQKNDGSYIVNEAKGGPEPGDERQLMAELWTRIKGQ